MAQRFTFQLTELQLAVLDEFARDELKNFFYWTGGTALAFFHLKHRDSFDIDFFTRSDIPHEKLAIFVKKLSGRIKLDKIQEKRIFDRREFFLKNGSETRLEFAKYDFPQLKKQARWNGILVDSLDDMAANKTMALLDRHESKDAFDMYYLLTKKRFTPARLLAMVSKKFGVNLSESSFWSQAVLASKSLSSITPLMPGTQLETIALREKIVGYFGKEATRYLRGQLGE